MLEQSIETGALSPPRQRGLATDPFAFAGGVIALFVALIFWAPGVSETTKETFANFWSLVPWLGLAVLSLATAIRRSESKHEKRFWLWLTVAFGLWLAAALGVATDLLSSMDPTLGLLLDATYMLYYLGWMVALEAKPHQSSLEVIQRGSKVGFAGRTFFVGALFAYLILIPRIWLPETYDSWVPSYLFYISLDLYLFGRLTHLWHRTSRNTPWHRRYGLLAIAVAVILSTDLIECASTIWAFDLPYAQPIDFLWFAPLFLVVLASRISDRRASSSAETDSDASKLASRLVGVPLLAYSIALPVFHISLELGGLGDSQLHGPREALVLVSLLVLFGLNLIQHLRLEKRNRALGEKRRLAEEKVRFLSRHDGLTGLLNRRELETQLEHALARAMRQDELMALLFLDLDHLKRINDNHGHLVGDAALRSAAECVRLCVREVDKVARYGGDEFVVALERIESPEVADSVAERILLHLDRGFEVDGEPFRLSGSIGIALFPDHGVTPRALIQAADQAMYEAKRLGGAQVGLAQQSRQDSLFTPGELRVVGD